jgi:hypothetical protein
VDRLRWPETRGGRKVYGLAYTLFVSTFSESEALPTMANQSRISKIELKGHTGTANSTLRKPSIPIPGVAHARFQHVV